MAYTQNDLDAVESAIAQGILNIRYADGRSVQYRSVSELKEARDIIKKSLSTIKRPRSYRARTSKGL